MYDVIIIGSGAAGLMCACHLSKKLKVLIIEKKSQSGLKLLITGGGRCNLTNLKEPNSFLDKVNYNKKFLYSAINTFSPHDIYNYFNNNGVSLKIETNDKIFPKSNQSLDILNVLLRNSQNHTFKYNETVLEIAHNEYYHIKTNKSTYFANCVVIATGGVSFKQTGSSGDHINFCAQLNQPLVPLFPAETSIKLKENLDLSGTSFEDVKIWYNELECMGNLIFTHSGLSGEAAMAFSENIYLKNLNKIYIDFFNKYSTAELVDRLNAFDKSKEMHSFLEQFFSKKFSYFLLTRLGVEPSIRIKQISNKDDLIKNFKKIEFLVIKKLDFETAYVTGGGVDLKHLNTSSFESKIHKNLYWIGECTDIHGPVGGYNLTLAFATAVLAARKIGEKYEKN